MLHRIILGLLTVACSLATPSQANWAVASLGGGVDSVRADAKALGGSLTGTRLSTSYKYRITVDGPAGVSEFVDDAGTVFAVAWSGPAPPKLDRLLGANYADYLQAWSSLPRPGLRRSVRVTGSKIVVEIGGHLRAYAGYAYLPASMPAGLAAKDLTP